MYTSELVLCPRVVVDLILWKVLVTGVINVADEALQ